MPRDPFRVGRLPAVIAAQTHRLHRPAPRAPSPLYERQTRPKWPTNFPPAARSSAGAPHKLLGLAGLYCRSIRVGNLCAEPHRSLTPTYRPASTLLATLTLQNAAKHCTQWPAARRAPLDALGDRLGLGQ